MTVGRGVFRAYWEGWRSAAFDHRIYIFILLAIAVGMYFGLPKRGDIDWPDAPRHALNGFGNLSWMTSFGRKTCDASGVCGPKPV